jgi:REP element-mobilizing transposase RayT
MPEHVHLLVSEPDHGTLADAMHFLKLSFAKRRKAKLVARELRFSQSKVPESTVPHSTVPHSTVPHSTVSHSTVPHSTVPQVRGRSVAANLGRTDVQSASTPFWQKRYYDRNVRDEDEFTVKLRYLHRNPVARGLVRNPADWKWSSFRHYALREKGPVEIESQWTASDRETRLHGRPVRTFLNPG